MHLKMDLRKYRLYIGFSSYVKFKGVNSTLPDGKHILLWDFDDIDIITLVNSLRAIQQEWGLSNIYIINTGLPKHHHAYCFTALDFATTLHILAEAKGIDMVYLSTGVIRGYFTLRFQPKQNRPFGRPLVLRSSIIEDASPQSLRLVKYFTKRR